MPNALFVMFVALCISNYYLYNLNNIEYLVVAICHLDGIEAPRRVARDRPGSH
jgi:hypothetical protein